MSNFIRTGLFKLRAQNESIKKLFEIGGTFFNVHVKFDLHTLLRSHLTDPYELCVCEKFVWRFLLWKKKLINQFA